MIARAATALASITCLSLFAAGCGSEGKGTAEIAAQRAKLLLASEPAGAVGVREARTMVKLGPSDDAIPSGGDNTPADKAHSDETPAAETKKPAEAATESTEPAKHDHSAAASGHADDDHAHAGHSHAGHSHDGHDHAHHHSHAGNAAGEGKQVVVVGKIGGVADPWEKGMARFMIVDVADTAQHDHEHGHDHDHAHDHAHGGHGHDHAHHDHAEGHECPFCDRFKPGDESLAIVEFDGGNGQPVAIDSRELFEIKKHQTVIIRGRARLDAADALVISADGIYVPAQK